MIPSRLGGLAHNNHVKFPSKLLEHFHVQPKSNSQLACFAAAGVWIPTAILAMIQGLFYFSAFLLDIAAQSRMLLAIPLLIVAEPSIIQHRFRIARLFLSNDLIKPEQASRFENIFSTFERRRKRRLTHWLLALIVYGILASFLPYLGQGTLPPWCSGDQILGRLSWAGAYYLFFGMPLLVYLVFRWMWNIVLWSLFLRSVSFLELRLVPSHPDLMAGLSFLETILRSYLPFAFSIGIIVAGGVANQVAHRNQSINAFRSIELAACCFVVLICVAPLFSFYDVMVAAKHRGTFEYGGFATKLGHEFEAKWIDVPTGPSSQTLEVPDFSTTTDLYSIAANVRQVKPVPFGMQSVIRLVAATIVPGIPVVIAAIPFDVLIDKLFKLLV
jgi:hypothetical protein